MPKLIVLCHSKRRKNRFPQLYYFLPILFPAKEGVFLFLLISPNLYICITVPTKWQKLVFRSFVRFWCGDSERESGAASVVPPPFLKRIQRRPKLPSNVARFSDNRLGWYKKKGPTVNLKKMPNYFCAVISTLPEFCWFNIKPCHLATLAS